MTMISLIKKKKEKNRNFFQYIFFPKNRRGDKIISMYWFAILIIVAAGIFGMVYVFYGSPYDVRQIEANVLGNQIADCSSYGGRINPNLVSNGKAVQKTAAEFLEMCHLNFQTVEWEEEQYYAQVEIYKLENMNSPFLEINAGNSNWLSSCALQADKEMERLAKCVRKSFYSLDDSNNQYIIKILTVVRKTEKNVKL